VSETLAVVGLGRMAYDDALTLQRAVAAARIDGRIADDVLLMVEHPPVITLGRGSHAEHLTTPPDRLAAQGVSVHEIERGGDVTYHGPGQLVGYPIYDLSEHTQDLHWFLRQLEACLIRALAEFGIAGERREGLTGVWTQGRKIASMGIHVKRWVTWHGFALNVLTRLEDFEHIVPCGIDGVVMTSVAKELGERTPRDAWGRALDAVMLGFADTFGQRPQAVTVDDIAIAAGVTPPA
jgi:lipoate-protein ligase B